MNAWNKFKHASIGYKDYAEMKALFTMSAVTMNPNSAQEADNIRKRADSRLYLAKLLVKLNP